jgi:hypothetical protein
LLRHKDISEAAPKTIMLQGAALIAFGRSPAGRVIRLPLIEALLDECADQAKELLLLWASSGGSQKGSDLHLGDPPTRWEVGLMPDEHPSGVGIAGEQPAIPVGSSAVNLSGSDSHGDFPTSDQW